MLSSNPVMASRSCWHPHRFNAADMNAHAHLALERDSQSAVVVVFLRGGADGLTLVPPIEDDNYHRFRPRLAVKKSEALRLDGPFGLHPELRALEPAWKDGDLAIVHGAGGEGESRSHFEAQDLMEHGGVVAGGWLGRFLRARGRTNSPLSAVAVGSALPEMLAGAPSATAFESAEEFSLGFQLHDPFARELQRLYADGPEDLRLAAQNTFEAVRRIEAIPTKHLAGDAAAYDAKDSFARGLRQIAALVKADVGLDAASIDLPGWDTHFTQQTGILPLMRRLANGLAAFRRDLGGRMATTTVVVLTEFGRRLAENSSFGTDHGRGSTLFILGGGVKGGTVLGGWRGLQPEILDGPGDLPVTTNYRDILAPVLRRHGAPEGSLRDVFPEFTLNPLPLYG
jgi:uncharacterized protein (DUF1501 family)